MKKYTVVLIPFLFLNTFIFASNQIFIKAGPNISYFLDAKNSSAMMGYALSINKEFTLFKELATSVGLGYAQRGAKLNNRRIEPYLSSEPKDAYYWDIEGYIGYLELPILLGYKYYPVKQILILPLVGVTFSYPKIDDTKIIKRKFYRVDDPDDPYDSIYYDYGFEQESGFGNNKWETIYNAGVRIQYRRMGLEFNYQINNKDVYNFSNVSKIYYKIYSVYCQIIFEF